MGFVDKFFDTPHSDALARESTVFENSFCTTPQCSPSRSSMLTRFYPHHTRMMNNNGALGGIDLDMETIGPKLQRLGYRTGFFGKWHLGGDPRGNAGWDEEHKRGPDAETTRRGVDFLKRHADSEQPFALFLMYLDPHDIYHLRAGRQGCLRPRDPDERFVEEGDLRRQTLCAQAVHDREPGTPDLGRAGRGLARVPRLLPREGAPLRLPRGSGSSSS